ncbi:MAG TPA: hypothetical protein VFC18_19945 [Burkholderiales bacterium]|nr:hypothetical protein [Burkholderiales bacterium]
MTAEPARSIEKLGFRRWYERQLIECHAWLVTCLLCAFAALALIEGLDFRAAFFGSLVRGAMAFAAGLLSWITLQRYVAMLVRANRLAEHATCGKCGTYGRFSFVEGQARVRCGSCEHEWPIG